MSTFIQDLHYALRTLRKSPLFTLVAVFTLALGIGANTAIFSVVNGVILKPLDYRQPQELLLITSQFPGLGFDKFWMSGPEYTELRERSRSFQAMGAFRVNQVTLQATDQPVRTTGAVATASLFDALGVPAALGRTFSEAEDSPAGDPVVVLSWEVWERAFGADRSLVGNTLMVDGQARTVVGIMPAGFDVDDSGVEAWVPLALDPANPPSRSSHFLYAVGRLAPGVVATQARAELETLLAQWPEINAGVHAPRPDGHRVAYLDLQEDLIGSIRPALMLLLGAVGFVLLIACANVANLLLARAEARQKEIAIRVAMGAGQTRLLRQFITESMTLALVGGLLGMGLGYTGLKLLLATSPGSIPRLEEITLDANVMGFTLVATLVTGILFGLAPILHFSGRKIGMNLRDGGGRSTVGAARKRVRGVLVAAEVALAVVLVVGSGLMMKSFSTLQQVNAGFDVEELLTFQLFLPAATYPDAASEAGFHLQLRERLEALPGVTAASAMDGLPPRRQVNANTMEFEGIEQTPDGPPHNVDYWQFVETGYFRTMGIDLVEGRLFSSEDLDPSVPAVLVNETMARTFWPEENPIGQRLRAGNPWLTVVGVVKDVKQGGLEEPTGTELYFYSPQVAGFFNFYPRGMNVVVRSAGDPATLFSAVRQVVWDIDSTLPLAQLQTMESNFSASVAQPRFLALLLAIFAGVALTLAAVGTYGVMSYSVAERSREIGIRMAIGAEAGAVQGMILRQGALVAGIGLVVGVVAARALAVFMESILFQVSATDPSTFVIAPAVLAAVALLACYLPARRATKVDPVRVLSEE